MLTILEQHEIRIRDDENLPVFCPQCGMDVTQFDEDDLYASHDACPICDCERNWEEMCCNEFDKCEWCKDECEGKKEWEKRRFSEDDDYDNVCFERRLSGHYD